MLRRTRWSPAVIAALALLAWLAAPATAQAPRSSIGKDFKQCENRGNNGGALAGTGPCITVASGSQPGWTNGGINGQHGLYRMNDYVPFRAIFTGLAANETYTLKIAYRAIHDRLHSYDYLGTYNRRSLVPSSQVVPCGGVGDTEGPHRCVGGVASTIAIPRDTNTAFPSGHSQELENVFSAWGATFVQSRPPVYTTANCSVCLPIEAGTTGDRQRQIDVTFTANGPTMVLAWGGHIASALDWGFGRTYAESGSGQAGFHMYLRGIEREGGGSSNTGQETLSLSSTATGRLGGFTTQVSHTLVQVDEPVIDTATLTARSGLPVAGEVRFFVCFNETTTPNCNQGGTEVTPRQDVLGTPNVNAVASGSFTPQQVGRYCFRAEYIPSADARYSARRHTNTSFTQPNAECFVAAESKLTVTKLCSPEDDPGRFNVTVAAPGNTTFGPTELACGGSAGPFDTTPGAHTIRESAGSDTNLDDYEPPDFSSNCAGGSITIALGQDATCVITNVRRDEPEASLELTKVCVPADDPGEFKFLLNGESQIASLKCGQPPTTVAVPTGPHTVREAGVPPTSLADYTTVISGNCGPDGSFTVENGQTAHCTFTNTRVPPTTTLRVDKACFPPGDTGRFNLTINGRVAGTGGNVGCGGTTGAVNVNPGNFTVGETGAGGTHLTDYNVTIGGACAPDGTVTVGAGQQLTCLITNERKGGPPSAQLTVTKICVPAHDGGRFNLTIDGQTSRDVRCGGRFGPVVLSPGQHRVSESAGTGTSLSDYTRSISGRCLADGSVTLAAGESATCVITNVRNDETPRPPEQHTAQITLVKQCTPADVTTRFHLSVDQTVFQNMRCGDSTGPVVVSTGDHAVGEVAVDGLPGLYSTVVSGDCSPNGTIALTAGQNATCTVTNTRRPVPPPPPRPPAVCYKLSVAPRMVRVGARVAIVARVHLLGRGVQGVRVYAAGAGVFDVRATGITGHAHFLLRLDRAGILRLRIRRPFACPPPFVQKIGVLGATLVRPPSVTG